MIPLVKRLVHAFLWDELAAVRWLRGALLLIGGGGIGFAEQLAAVVDAPDIVKTIKIVAIICLFLGGAITAGQRNPQPSDAS